MMSGSFIGLFILALLVEESKFDNDFNQNVSL